MHLRFSFLAGFLMLGERLGCAVPKSRIYTSFVKLTAARG